MLDMQQLWNYLDNEILVTPMPKEYENFYVDILCKDCHEVSNVKFHVVGLKCQNTDCGGYNTTRTQKRVDSKKTASGGSAQGGPSNDDAAAPGNTNNYVA